MSGSAGPADIAPVGAAVLAADVDGLDAEQVLAAFAQAEHLAQQAEALKLTLAARWAWLHREPEMTMLGIPFPERLVQIGGDGTPPMREYAPAELGLVIGLGDAGSRRLLSDALDLTTRLPHLWQRARAGEVSAWKARRVAEQTTHLSAEVAAKVDADIADYARSLTPSRLSRLVRAAIIEHDHAAELSRAQGAAADRGVWIDPPGDDGNTSIFIRTDHATAAWFDATLNQIAHTLADGTGSSLQQRRATALGHLGATAGGPPAKLYVHVNEATLTGQTHVARVEGVGAVHAELVREWLGDARVTVVPVIDLSGQVPIDNYETPGWLREAVTLRSPVDTFPHGGAPSRRLDLDHTRPYQWGGPRGQTRDSNLAPLTRRHHRMKTNGRWRVTQVSNGVLAWTSPHGRHYVTDHNGTHQVRRT